MRAGLLLQCVLKDTSSVIRVRTDAIYTVHMYFIQVAPPGAQWLAGHVRPNCSGVGRRPWLPSWQFRHFVIFHFHRYDHWPKSEGHVRK